ncbi:MAG: hypothetical protein A3F90_18220 [Deltaproteobacteria bacterium RIFCSPLOWO2_12_FULL_60_19]|nr:MAG: hypothetical protein A3F90_18220 [Deltaproteobacteria bacterium RIFCSPLOWO2_12_FULL_60_19]
MFYKYRFESEIYPEMSRIPLHVRMKLDLTGVKMSLKAWLAFSLEERNALCELPVETDEERVAFTGYAHELSRRYFGEPAALAPPVANPAWENQGRVPDSVAAKGREVDHPVTLAEWRAWNCCQRYALIKLSVTKNEPELFIQAIKEFGGENS